MKRMIFSILILTAFFMISALYCAIAADANGPLKGKWAFSGKDDKGVIWTGTLTVTELDTNAFDANKYYSGCVLDIASNDGGKGVDSPCIWNAAKRELSFGAGSSSYSATLSADSKGMSEGKWTETERDFQTRKVTIKGTGVWSAKFMGQ